MQAQSILETALYAEDLLAAERFYCQVLGLEVFARQLPRHVFFRCGEAMLLLFNPAVTAAEPNKTDAGEPIPGHGARGPGHVAFRVSPSEMAPWREHLKNCCVPIDQEVAWPSGGRSLYFRDPAGNHLELATPAVWGLT